MSEQGVAAPKWEHEGVYECPECGEKFYFMREDGWEEMKGWVLQVYHDHTEDREGVWRAAAYRTWKGRRRPSITKDVEQQRKDAYQREVARRQVENASS